MILFYNVLCVVFEAYVQRTDGCGSGLEMSVYPVHQAHSRKQSYQFRERFCIVPDSHTYHYAFRDVFFLF